MGSFSRLRYVIAANVNSLLEKAENPEKLLRALIHYTEDASEDARLARNLDARVTQLEFDMAQLKSKMAEAKAKLKDIQTRSIRSYTPSRTPTLTNRKYKQWKCTRSTINGELK
jgi:phage shock protein A